MENRNILAQKGQDIVLLDFGEGRRKFDKTEKEIENIDDGVPVVVDFVENPNRPAQIACFQFGNKVFELDIRNIRAQLLHEGEIDRFIEDVYFLEVIDKHTDGVIADIQQKLFCGGFDGQVFLLDNFVHGRHKILADNLVHFQNMQTRLQALVYFLDIGADGYEHDIFGILVDIVAKDLLALFIDGVDIVDDDDFFFIWNIGRRLTEGFHFRAKILDALFFEIVDKGDIVLGERGVFVHAVILANDGVHERCFAGAGISHDEKIEIAHFLQGF